MTHLLEKETPFVFSKDCIDAFQTLKKKLTEAPILVVPDWNLPFELMCDASDFAIGAVLGQRRSKHFQPIHYAMYTNHSALKYLMNKQNAKPRLLRWVLPLEEFDITIRDKKGSENHAADHLSRLENHHKDVLENKDINKHFPLETLGAITSEMNAILVALIIGFMQGERDCCVDARALPAGMNSRVVGEVLAVKGGCGRDDWPERIAQALEYAFSPGGLRSGRNRCLARGSDQETRVDALWAYRSARHALVVCNALAHVNSRRVAIYCGADDQDGRIQGIDPKYSEDSRVR
ncbi:reverse transcriptase domain-containing protein [Tanacetum coccineum]